MRQRITKKEISAAINLYGHGQSDSRTTTRQPAEEDKQTMQKESMKNSLEEFFASMETADRPEQSDAEKWDKETNPVIAGELIDYKHVDLKNGESGDIVIVNDMHIGKVRFWMTAVLRTAWQDWEPLIGETVGIRYLGQKSCPNGAYNDYVFMVMGRDKPGHKPLAATPKPVADKPDPEDPFDTE